MIELYIENRKIDLPDTIDISMVLETVDPDNLASVKNSFSKTVTIPGTTNNNETFGYIFRNDRNIPTMITGRPIGLLYDPHKKVNYLITENGTLVNRGYCTLDSITVKNEYTVEYKVTLYGGIGEFFYSLSYNEDGSTKTLADLYWDWYALKETGYDNIPLTSDQENTDILYYASLKNVTSQYTLLSPAPNTHQGTTQIGKDITFVPCYTGLYDDFDAEHMLVCDFNWRDDHLLPLQNNYLSNPTLQELRKSFSSLKIDPEDNTKTYSTVGKTFSPNDAYTFGLAKFSREVDPFEAANLRINELPMAVRLSKLLYRISQPENNGGYTVEWDNAITNSYYWNYGWVMFGKMKNEDKRTTYATVTPSATSFNDTISINLDSTGSSVSPNTISERTMTITDWSNNLVDLKFTQEVKFNLMSNTNNNDAIKTEPFVSGGCSYYDGRTFGYAPGRYYEDLANYICILTEVSKYNGEKIVNTNLDVFFFYDQEYFSSNGLRLITKAKEFIKSDEFIARVNEEFGTDLTANDITPHYCDLKYNIYTNPTLAFKTISDSISVTIPAETENPTITQKQFYAYVFARQKFYNSTVPTIDVVEAGIYGIDHPYYISELVQTFFGCRKYSNATIWPTSAPNLNYINTDLTSNFISGDTIEGYNNLELTKAKMFADTETPMKYLTDFCKIMNLSFVCDNTQKKISILTKKSFYNGLNIDLTDRIDHSRDISIKNILTQSKTISVGLDTPESYPVYLFDKNVKDKFNNKNFETGIEYSIKTENLFKSIMYKNTLDWQQNSIFYNIFPQIPKPYNAITVSWTLWEYQNDEHNTKEFILGGVSPISEKSQPINDFMPKVALFDKDNKQLSAYPTFIFLNGFIKNYDYILSKDNQTTPGFKYTIAPRILFANDTSEQYILNGQRCYINAFNYGPDTTFTDYGFYQGVDYNATSWVLPFFTRDLYNVKEDVWEYAGKIVASWNMNEQPGLDSLYQLTTNTEFMTVPEYPFSVQYTSDPELPTYTINNTPKIDNRIYDISWQKWLSETYDRNSKEITTYVDLNGLGNINSLMRNFYTLDSNMWIITKVDGYKINNFGKDKFAKTTLKRVVDKTNFEIEI